MAERMTVMRTLVCWLTPALTAVAAEPLRDPTRPPAISIASTPDTGARSAPAPIGTLTAIRIDQRQRVATIGGVRVTVGDTVPEGIVRAIRATEVVLATPAGPRVLKLYPGVARQLHDERARRLARLAERSAAKPARDAAADAPPASIQGEPAQ